MNLQEKAIFYYNENGKNCAEAILLATSDVYNLNLNDEDAKLLVGFGGGMGCGSVCGCLAASIAVIGKIFYGNEKIREICAEFTSKFKKTLQCDSIDCSGIAPVYKTVEKRCEKAVAVSSDLLEEFLNKYYK